MKLKDTSRTAAATSTDPSLAGKAITLKGLSEWKVARQLDHRRRWGRRGSLWAIAPSLLVKSAAGHTWSGTLPVIGHCASVSKSPQLINCRRLHSDDDIGHKQEPTTSDTYHLPAILSFSLSTFSHLHVSPIHSTEALILFSIWSSTHQWYYLCKSDQRNFDTHNY